MLLASTFLEALVPDGPGAGKQALFPTEEYTVPDTVSVKVKQRVKGLPRILQEIRALTAHLPGIDAFRDAADMAYRERPETPSTV